jgi:hypothetical protein
LLQQNREYADHWITLWNDLLRDEDGVAYPGETRERIIGWLLQTLETNMPYDRMVVSLLNRKGNNAPRGFLAGINWAGDVSASTRAGRVPSCFAMFSTVRPSCESRIMRARSTVLCSHLPLRHHSRNVVSSAAVSWM